MSSQTQPPRCECEADLLAQRDQWHCVNFFQTYTEYIFFYLSVLHEMAAYTF